MNDFKDKKWNEQKAAKWAQWAEELRAGVGEYDHPAFRMAAIRELQNKAAQAAQA